MLDLDGIMMVITELQCCSLSSIWAIVNRFKKYENFEVNRQS